MLRKAVGCFYCMSVWVALPFAFFLEGSYSEIFVGWLALSGAAILLERITGERLDVKIQGEEPWDVAEKR